MIHGDTCGAVYWTGLIVMLLLVIVSLLDDRADLRREVRRLERERDGIFEDGE